MALSKNKLKEYRENAGLSQEKIAELVTVTRQTNIPNAHILTIVAIGARIIIPAIIMETNT